MRTAYLDIETSYEGKLKEGDLQLLRDYSNHRITVIGIRVLDEDQDTLVQLVGQDISKGLVLGELNGVGRLVTYNGRSIPDSMKGYVGFDFPVIAARLGVVLDKEFNHLDLCPQCWKAGFYGGQKAVEARLGLKRTLQGKDGAWADKTFKQYETSKDERYLNELLAYNKEDVLMLRRIEEGLRKWQR